MPDLWDESSFKMQNSCQIDPYLMTMGEAEIVGCQNILGKDGIWAEWFYNHTRWNRSEVRLHSSLSDQEGVPPLAHSLLQSCTIEGGFIVVVFHTIQMLHTLKLAGRRMLRLAQSCTKSANPVVQPPTRCGPAHASLLHNNCINSHLPLPIPVN